MDYGTIKAGLAKVVPMNTHLGLELLEVGDGRGVVRLPDDARMLNHVGSQHAAGLFAAGEFASGAAMTGALAAHLANATPLAATAIAERLAADGRAEFAPEIEMTDEQGVVVATMTVQWHVRQRR